MFRLGDLDNYIPMILFDVFIVFFWWKLMALLGDRRMLPSPESAMSAGADAKALYADTGDNGGQDGSWKNFPTIVKVTLVLALVVSFGILLEGALLMPLGVWVWGWQAP
jgi:hypothetical protein